MATNPDDDLPQLAHWLQESGRRKFDPAWADKLYRQDRRPSVDPPKRLLVTQPIPLSLFALAVFAYLNYYFLQVHLEIASMPKVIVFIATKERPS
jgi:hypothetical protein